MLTNPEKAVVFLLSLDEEVARTLVGDLGPAELKKLRTVAASMKQIATNSLDDTFKEFLDKTETEVALPRGGVRYLRRLTTTTHGEDKARDVFDEGTIGPMARLERAKPEELAQLLATEPVGARPVAGHCQSIDRFDNGMKEARMGAVEVVPLGNERRLGKTDRSPVRERRPRVLARDEGAVAADADRIGDRVEHLGCEALRIAFVRSRGQKQLTD